MLIALVPLLCNQTNLLLHRFVFQQQKMKNQIPREPSYNYSKNIRGTQSECSITQKVDFVNSSFQPTQEISFIYEPFFSLSACFVCSCSSDTDKASAMFKVWAGSWSWREGKNHYTYKLTCAPLKVRLFHSQCFPSPASQSLCFGEFSAKRSLLLLSSFPALPLSWRVLCEAQHRCQRKRVSEEGLMPKAPRSRSLENLPTAWPG